MFSGGVSNNNAEPLISRRVFSGGLIAAALTGALHPLHTTPAFAEPTSAEKQAEADKVKRQLDLWAEELDQATTRYYLAIEAHEDAVRSMSGAMVRIRVAEAELMRLQSNLGARVKFMYKQGQYNFLDVLFGARSFVEFTTTWDLINIMNSEDAALIKRSKAAKKEAQSARDEYAILEKLAQQKLEEANEIKARAEQIVADYEAQLAALEAEVAELIEKERIEEERRQQEAALIEATGGAGWGNGIPIYTKDKTEAICEAAISRLGCPYVWAATGPDTFDCSGLTQWCYAQVGVYIPRVDTTQRAAATSVLPVSEALPGDILWKPGHVGIYMGDGAYIHAPYPGEVVRYAYNMSTWYNTCRY